MKPINILILLISSLLIAACGDNDKKFKADRDKLKRMRQEQLAKDPRVPVQAKESIQCVLNSGDETYEYIVSVDDCDKINCDNLIERGLTFYANNGLIQIIMYEANDFTKGVELHMITANDRYNYDERLVKSVILPTSLKVAKVSLDGDMGSAICRLYREDREGLPAMPGFED